MKMTLNVNQVIICNKSFIDNLRRFMKELKESGLKMLLLFLIIAMAKVMHVCPVNPFENFKMVIIDISQENNATEFPEFRSSVLIKDKIDKIFHFNTECN